MKWASQVRVPKEKRAYIGRWRSSEAPDDYARSMGRAGQDIQEKLLTAISNGTYSDAGYATEPTFGLIRNH